MTKKKIIEEIKAIIKKWGGFTTADIQADSSPCIKSMGRKTIQLAESFYKDKVEGVIYINDIETESENIAYEDLPKDVLEEILGMAQRWEELEGESL